jgi:hypothetical protein
MAIEAMRLIPLAVMPCFASPLFVDAGLKLDRFLKSFIWMMKPRCLFMRNSPFHNVPIMNGSYSTGIETVNTLSGITAW